MEKITVGLLGATGEVGQKFVINLQKHPWFELKELYASERSAGKSYADALSYGGEDTRWFVKEKPEKSILNMEVSDVKDAANGEVSFFFSALPSETALEAEGKIAKEKPVVSTASAYRYFDDSFTYLPSINESHAKIVDIQRKNRGWKGFVVPQPNCTTIGLAMSLKPIYDSFGLDRVTMASMQAVSGAGYAAMMKWSGQRKAQGTALPEILGDFESGTFEGNVIPYIKGEEEKVKKETVKLLGNFVSDKILPADFKVACKCNRAAVLDGHTESVFIETKKACDVNGLKKAWTSFKGEPQRLKLPTAPEQPIVVTEAVDRPQPRFDSATEGGMAAIIGGVEANTFKNGFQYTVLSHNTELGAAKGAVMAAEYLVKISLIK